MDNERITIQEAMHILHKSEKQVRRYVKTKRLSAEIGKDGKYHILKNDVDRLARHPDRIEVDKVTRHLEDLGQSIVELEKRLDDLTTQRLAKLDDLQSRIEAIEQTLTTMTPPQNQEASTVTTMRNRDIHSITPQRTRLTPGETTLPTGYRGFTEFFKAHGIPETTASRVAHMGIFEILSNGWKVDGTSVKKVLDPEAQRLFCEHFRKRSGSFHACEVEGCPCHE